MVDADSKKQSVQRLRERERVGKQSTSTIGIENVDASPMGRGGLVH
jgi:hypothetical protein